MDSNYCDTLEETFKILNIVLKFGLFKAQMFFHKQ